MVGRLHANIDYAVLNSAQRGPMAASIRRQKIRKQYRHQLGARWAPVSDQDGKLDLPGETIPERPSSQGAAKAQQIEEEEKVPAQGATVTY
jgi:hypothetical protein